MGCIRPGAGRGKQERQTDAEDAPPAIRALDLDPAAVASDDLVDDIQADAEPADGRAGGAGAVVLKQVLLCRGGNTGARVLHLQNRLHGVSV